MKTFEELGLSKELLRVIDELKFTNPSEIQEKAIPLALTGRDIVGGSATGSGKTLAFSAPILEKLIPNKNVQALILTPTRELAEQVANSIRGFSLYKDIKVLALYGGVDIEAQIRKLSRADIVVGTPGRILDHLERRTLNLSSVKFLVLDEVDRMLDMGFSRDVERILKQCPEKKQTFLFSATISNDISHLIKKYTNNPAEISVDSYVDHSKLKQVYYDVPSGMKFSLLVYLLKKEKANLVMVFSNTRRNADFIAGNLFSLGINAKVIHGGLEQKKRLKVLEEFHGKGVGVLICTDVAARGLDIKGVTHVYNYDTPDVANDYIHRIGRTARAGTEGIAINLVSSRDYLAFGSVMQNKELQITKEELPEFPKIEVDNGAGKKKEFRASLRSPSSRGSPRDSGSSRGSFSRGPRRSFSRDSEDKPRRSFSKSSDDRPARKSFSSSERPREGFGKKVFSKARILNEEFTEKPGEFSRGPRKSFGRTGAKKSFGRSSEDDSPRRSFSGERRSSLTRGPLRKNFQDRKVGGENRSRSGRFTGSRTPRREIARTEEKKSFSSSGPRINRDSKYKRTPTRDSKKTFSSKKRY